jgi:thiamine pyrophosphokinase
MTNNGHHFAILLGGDLTPTKRLRQQIAGARFIAADSGMRHAEALGVTPELWVGDFDSADIGLQRKFADVPKKQFPVAKDMTDGALAIAEALQRGATRLTLLGGFGGQFDHTLSHGLQLVALAEKGVESFMSSGDEEAFPLLSQLSLDGLSVGTRISILGLSELHGLSIDGVRWPLDTVNLSLGSTWTMSNETGGDVNISIEQGQALVLVYPKETQV